MGKKVNYSDLIKNKDCLFRYRSCNESSLKALEQNRLYFSNPSSFNDPYDNLVYADSSKIVNEIIGSLNAGMDDYINKNVFMNRYPYNIGAAMWKLNKDGTIKEHIKRIYAAIDAVRIHIRKNSRVICFSEVNDSMLMWSHYADYHKGFLLVYDKEKIENSHRFDTNDNEITEKMKLMQVNYVSNQTDLTTEVLEYVRNNIFENLGDVPCQDSTISPAKIRTVICEKARDWSYEKEWRLIPRAPHIEKQSRLHYICCKPEALILGSKCDGDNRKNIINICEKNKIPVYGIFLSETSANFSLMINQEGNTELASNEYVYIPRKGC